MSVRTRALAQADQRVGEILVPSGKERCHCRQTCVAHVLLSNDPIGFKVVSTDRDPLPHELRRRIAKAVESAEEESGRQVLSRDEIDVAVRQSGFELVMDPRVSIA